MQAPPASVSSVSAASPPAPAMASDGDDAPTRAARDAGLFVYSRLAASVLGIVVIVAGARLYDQADFGFLTGLVMLHATALALGSLGLPDAVYYFVGRDPGAAAALARQTTFLLVAISPPVIAVMWLGGAIFSTRVDLAASLPWLALTVALELPAQPAINQLIATGRARLASGIYVALMALRVVAVLVPGALGLGAAAIPPLMAAAAVARLLVYVALVRRFFPLPAATPWLDRARLREILAFSLPVGAAALAGQLNPQVDKYAIGWILGAAGLGLYGAASIELPLITLVPYAIGAVMQRHYVARWYAGDVAGLRALWLATARKVALIVAPLVIVVTVVAEATIVLVFGEAYAAAALPLRIFTLGLLHRVAAYGPMLQAVGRAHVIMRGAIAMVALNVALVAPCIWLLGFPGAAVASVASMLLGWLYLLVHIGDALGVGLRGVLPWRHYAAVLALALPLGALAWGALEARAWSPATAVAAIVPAYLVLYVVLARLTRLMSAADLRYLRDWLTLRMLRERRGEAGA